MSMIDFVLEEIRRLAPAGALIMVDEKLFLGLVSPDEPKRNWFAAVHLPDVECVNGGGYAMVAHETDEHPERLVTRVAAQIAARRCVCSDCRRKAQAEAANGPSKETP